MVGEDDENRKLCSGNRLKTNVAVALLTPTLFRGGGSPLQR